MNKSLQEQVEHNKSVTINGEIIQNHTLALLFS